MPTLNNNTKSPIVTVAFFINISLAIFVSTLWMKTLKYTLYPQLYTHTKETDTLHTQYNPLLQHFKSFAQSIFNLHSIQKIILLLSLYLFLHFAVKSFLQFIAEYFPRFSLSKIIKCLNNIIDSMLVFSFILGFILLAMWIDNYQAEKQSELSLSNIQKDTIIQNTVEQNHLQLQSEQVKHYQKVIFSLLETFFYSRVLFSIGYLFGTITKLESFRAIGVGLTMCSIVVGLSQTYGFDAFAYF